MTQEEQKVQELLKPRYLLTADFPGCSFEVGTILVPNEEGELYSKQAGYSWTVSRVLEKDVKKFKHLFRKLEWWEEHDASEMPEYVKPDPNGALEQFRSQKTIYKVQRWVRDDNNLWCEVGKHDHIHVNHILPATSSEYNNYNNAQKIQL